MSDDPHSTLVTGVSLDTIERPTSSDKAKETSVPQAAGEPWTARLPRPLRVLAHGWWKFFSFLFVGNYLAGLVIALFQGGWTQFVTTLTSWGFVAPLEKSSPIAFWLGTGLLAALALAGLTEELAERRAAQMRIAARERTLSEAHQSARSAQETAQSAQATAQSAQETAERALSAVSASIVSVSVPQPMGPPDDVALLPAPEYFVGREADRAWVVGRLRSGGASASMAVVGLAGIGKTTLVAVALRQLQQEDPECFPDGIGVVFCQSLTDPAIVLRQVLIRFDPYRRAPEAAGLPQLQETALATLRRRRALVVLDNVEPELAVAGVVAPLRAAGLQVLITARQALPSEVVPADASRPLDLLRFQEALDLFASAAGRGNPSAFSPEEYTAAQTIVGNLGYHTLAVKLAGATAASEGRDFEGLAQQLSNPGAGLALSGDDETPEAVRRSFAISLDALPVQTRQLFAGLAAFASPECGRQATLALGAALGIPHPEHSVHLLVVRALVDALTLQMLPAESDRERLQLHPLLRVLAEELFRLWPPAEQEVAASAVSRHLAAYAEAQQSNDTAVAADEENLSGALEWAQQREQTALTVQLAHGMRLFWHHRGRYREGVRYLAWGIAAAKDTVPSSESLTARQKLAELQLAYGHVLVYSGKPEEGATVLEECLQGFRALQDRQGEGVALTSLSEAAWSRSQYELAEASLQQSLTIARDIGDRQGEEAAVTGLGIVALHRGQFETAEAFLQQSVVTCREVGDRREEIRALYYLGRVMLYRGQYEKAEDYLQQVLAFDREIGDRQGQGTDLVHLGDIALRRGESEAAETLLQQSLAVMREVGDRGGEGQSLTLLGQVAMARRQYEAAGGNLEQALAIHREVGDRRWEAPTQATLGRVAEAQGEVPKAEILYRGSLALASEAGLGPEIAMAQLALGRLLTEQLNRREEGCPLIMEATQRFTEMGMPEAEEAREVVWRLGCGKEAD